LQQYFSYIMAFYFTAEGRCDNSTRLTNFMAQGSNYIGSQVHIKLKFGWSRAEIFQKNSHVKQKQKYACHSVFNQFILYSLDQ